MHRRDVLTITTAFSIAFSGCLSQEDDEPNDGQDETGENKSIESDSNENENVEDCATVGHLEVYVTIGDADEETITDPEEEFDNLKYFKKALSEAVSEYEGEKDQETKPDEQYHPKNKLTVVYIEGLSDRREVKDEIGYMEPKHVNYNGYPLTLIYIESAC